MTAMQPSNVTYNISFTPQGWLLDLSAISISFVYKIIKEDMLSALFFGSIYKI